MSEGRGGRRGKTTGIISGVVVTSVEAATSAVIIVTSVADATSAVMTSGEAVSSAATPIDSVASCMVVTFVTVAPWAIAFAGTRRFNFSLDVPTTTNVLV